MTIAIYKDKSKYHSAVIHRVYDGLGKLVAEYLSHCLATAHAENLGGHVETVSERNEYVRTK